MSDEIIDALRGLDPENDEHWTSKGLPQTAVVANVTGRLTLTRAELLAVAPDFNRAEARRLRSTAAAAGDPQPPPPDDDDDDDDDEDRMDDEDAATASDEQAKSYAASSAPDPFAPDAPTSAEAAAAIREALREAKQRELNAVRQQIGELRQVEARLTAEIDQLIAETAREEGPHENQKAIMAWVEGQNQERRRRAERQAELLNKGVHPHELSGRTAPIDAAMARGYGYGHNRPKYPQMKAK